MSFEQEGILTARQLGFQWETADPFLFCVHHEDFYPHGNEQLGPAASLSGRNIGQDFDIPGAGRGSVNDWRMYHGEKIPGFPGHPHRGFETVTVVRRGLVDHADSLGAAGRYGAGDVQWMTAGAGVQHSEMFPLIHQDKENTLELFQIWLNLPAKNKFVKPHFQMLWKEQIPVVSETDASGRRISIEIIAGEYGGKKAPAPPPDSWAADPAHGVAIWHIELEAGARWVLPAAPTGIQRSLYFYSGETLGVGNAALPQRVGMKLQSGREFTLFAAEKPAKLLLLQGKPIAEPVVQYGPFVMNSRAEIEQAFADYQKTRFGGWPWPGSDPVHGRGQGRFARHADGRQETASG